MEWTGNTERFAPVIKEIIKMMIKNLSVKR